MLPATTLTLSRHSLGGGRKATPVTPVSLRYGFRVGPAKPDHRRRVPQVRDFDR